MKPHDLPDLAHFVAVARHRNFTRAAAELAITRSALSHSVAALERRLGTRLLDRTTRSVAPTEAGETVLRAATPALDAIERALAAACTRGAAPGGRLRLNLPRIAAVLAVAPRLAGFMAAHPGIELEISVDDATLDIVAARYDAGMRFGEQLAGDMVAIPVGKPLAFAVVGAPGYFAGRSRPAVPADLARHECIKYRMRGSGALFAWEFERDGREISVAVPGRLTLDSAELMVRAARDGLGLAYTALDEVRPLLESGELVRVLKEWCPAKARLFLYHPGRRHMAPALRALIDWLRRPAQ